jgi:HEPN domain-containing protein
MQPDEVKLGLTRDWLTKAEHDLLAAERAALTPPIPDVVAFHCQQAVEKALKGFLTWHDSVFGRTHYLLGLVEQCEERDLDFSSLREAARLLNPYAVEARYSGPLVEPTPEEATSSLQLAREALSFICARLPEEVQPGE